MSSSELPSPFRPQVDNQEDQHQGFRLGMAYAELAGYDISNITGPDSDLSALPSHLFGNNVEGRRARSRTLFNAWTRAQIHPLFPDSYTARIVIMRQHRAREDELHPERGPGPKHSEFTHAMQHPVYHAFLKSELPVNDDQDLEKGALAYHAADFLEDERDLYHHRVSVATFLFMIFMATVFMGSVFLFLYYYIMATRAGT